MPQPRSAKKSTGRRTILGLVLAARGDVQCIMLAERGTNKSDGWGLGSSAGEWSMRPAGGKLMRLQAETRSVLLMDGVWAVPLRSGPCNTAGRKLMRPKAETRSVLRRAMSSARAWKVSSVWYVPGDQHDGPLPSHCCCGRRRRRKGAPSIEKPPVKEQGLWARWKAKTKSLRKQLSEGLEARCHNSKSSQRRRHIVRVFGGDTECPLQVC